MGSYKQQMAGSPGILKSKGRVMGGEGEGYSHGGAQRAPATLAEEPQKEIDRWLGLLGPLNQSEALHLDDEIGRQPP